MTLTKNNFTAFKRQETFRENRRFRIRENMWWAHTWKLKLQLRQSPLVCHGNFWSNSFYPCTHQWLRCVTFHWQVHVYYLVAAVKQKARSFQTHKIYHLWILSLSWLKNILQSNFHKKCWELVILKNSDFLSRPIWIFLNF